MGSFPEMYNDPKIVSSSLLVPHVVAFFFQHCQIFHLLFFDSRLTVQEQ